MKRRDLVNLLKKNNWYFLREGSNHEIWTDGVNVEAVPRHREINERTAQGILKRRGLK